MATSKPDVRAMVDDAMQRLRATGKPDERLVIFLQKNGAPKVVAALLSAFEREPRIVLSTVTQREAGPVGTPGGGHVNAVEHSFTPHPSLVLVVSERDGLVYLAARRVVGDPFASSPWDWTLQMSAHP